MLTIEKIKEVYFDKLADILNEQFPKGECKERGHALVLNSYANIYLKEAILTLLKKYGEEIIGEDEISEVYGYKKADNSINEIMKRRNIVIIRNQLRKKQRAILHNKIKEIK